MSTPSPLADGVRHHKSQEILGDPLYRSESKPLRSMDQEGVGVVVCFAVAQDGKLHVLYGFLPRIESRYGVTKADRRRCSSLLGFIYDMRWRLGNETWCSWIVSDSYADSTFAAVASKALIPRYNCRSII
jgi:hypothetical protein